MANDFLPFATDPTANVISQGAWSALGARPGGFVSGVAKSAQVNKALRQSTAMAAAIGAFVDTFSSLSAIDDGDIDALRDAIGQTMQGAPWGYAVATGTANAWVVTPSLAVPAYAAGRVLWVKAPATNTSTTVNANVSGLGNRRIKKADGTDPAVGDLISGVWHPTIDDGSNICIVKNLPSDINAAVRAAPVYGLVAAPATTFNVPDNTITKISSFGTVVNNLPSTTLASGDLTVGLTGYYDISFYLGTNYALQAGSYSFVSAINVNGVSKIGSSGASLNSSGLGLGTFFSGAGLLKLTAGDVLTLTQKHNSGVTQNGPMGLSIVFRGA